MLPLVLNIDPETEDRPMTRNVNDNAFFREVTLRICSSLDIEEALIKTFDYVHQFIPADTMGLGYSDLKLAYIRTVASAALDNGTIRPEDKADLLLSKPQADYVRAPLNEKPPTLAVNRPTGHPPALLSLFPELQKNSGLFMRLDLHGEEFGALYMTAAGHDRFTQRHIDLINSVRKPFTIAMINARQYHETARMKERLAEDNRALSADIRRNIGTKVVGADFGLKPVMDQVRRIAPSTSPCLIQGETGTGKEVIANAIHLASPRNRGPMISMQCGAIPDTLLDSELFGHEKGAFTGAAARKRGRFERAHGGTLFLDEIGELSPEAQVKLLRVIQEHRFERVGGTRTIETDVRVIAATHRDLEKMVRDGSFREDLWYRLNVLPIRIPPLRLRKEDIPSLVQYFVKRKVREMNLPLIPAIDDREYDRLSTYNWPGNIRELQNMVETRLDSLPGRETDIS